jgi:hypothetical protein
MGAGQTFESGGGTCSLGAQAPRTICYQEVGMKAQFVALAASALAAATLSTAALAGTAVGAGLTWTFGGPKPVAGPALGIKVFSNDREKKAAGYLGLDYSFADRGLRPNVGVAYLGENHIYLGADVGYSFAQQGVNFGAGLGYVDTKRRD